MSGLDKQFRESQEKDMALEDITNPYSQDFSFNFDFDTDDLIDSGASDSNVDVAGGKLVLTSGTSGKMVSVPKTASANVSNASYKITGEDLGNVTVEVSADNGNNYQTLTSNQLSSITSTGRNLRVRVTLESANAKVDALAIYYS